MAEIGWRLVVAAGLFGAELQKVAVAKRGLGLLSVSANLAVPTFRMTRLSPGIHESVQKLMENGKTVYLISGGFRLMINYWRVVETVFLPFCASSPIPSKQLNFSPLLLKINLAAKGKKTCLENSGL
ncbi:phosphoserine phosphatase, chloroplastic [Tanacetum coccineum]